MCVCVLCAMINILCLSHTHTHTLFSQCGASLMNSIHIFSREKNLCHTG